MGKIQSAVNTAAGTIMGGKTVKAVKGIKTGVEAQSKLLNELQIGSKSQSYDLNKGLVAQLLSNQDSRLRGQQKQTFGQKLENSKRGNQ